MRKPLFAFVIVALVFVCTASSASPEPAGPAVPMPASPQEGGGCGVEEPHCISHEFSPGDNSFVYDFSTFDGSTLRVNFVGGVISTFTLTVRDRAFSDEELAGRLDPNVFPPETTSCFHYFDSPTPLCHEYRFTGSAGGPNGVPLIGVDFNRPGIVLTLTYFTPDTAFDPAFGHAPGESTTFSEDILRDYFTVPSEDDTMDSDPIPGLSSVIALNKQLKETDTYCWVSPQDGQTFRSEDDEIEVAFRLFASGSCSGTPLRDGDARLSLWKLVNVNGDVESQHVRFVHFRFEPGEGVNEAEIETEGLTPGTYFITVRSDKFSPQTRQICIEQCSP